MVAVRPEFMILITNELELLIFHGIVFKFHILEFSSEAVKVDYSTLWYYILSQRVEHAIAAHVCSDYLVRNQFNKPCIEDFIIFSLFNGTN